MSTESEQELEGIAIIGMAGRFPGAPNVARFWENLKNGVDSIADLTDEDLVAAGIDPAVARDPRYVRRYGALDRIEWFDAPFFRMTPREARLLDPQQRALLECAWEALEHAGHAPSRFAGSIGVYAGMGAASYLLSNLLTSPEIAHPADLPAALMANEKDFVASRIAHRLDLRGPAVTVQTACSTSLVAVATACLNLLTHQCDMALAGGATIAVPQRGGYLYQEGSILSPEGKCRAFDAGARGAVGGSGAGLVVLKRHADAVADGDTIWAVIHGFALNNDGAGKASFTAPSVDGQAEVIAKALAMAGFDAATIGYVEAHGTGTALGDPIEVQALSEAFRASAATPSVGSCALASLKTNVGHLDAAAGVAGLIKAAMAVREGVIPPTLHFERPNPAIDFATSPFYVNAALAPWPTRESRRRAGVSSFGVGGTNAHVVLEEAPAREVERAGRPVHVLPLAARTPTALARMAENLADALTSAPELALADVAFTLQHGREPFAHRCAVAASCHEAAIAALRAAAVAAEASTVAASSVEPVMLFPGQGSHHVGMGRDLYAHEAVFRDAVDRCAEILKPLLGVDLRDLIFGIESDASEAELARPSRVQPALFTIEYALAALWKSCGVTPRAMIGHSIGEYAAAYVAGVFTLEDALRIVARRGALVEALPAGAMLAVPLSEHDVRACLPAGLDIAAVNAETRTVVAGPPSDVDAFAQMLSSRGVETKRLPIPRAYHSAMLDGALADLAVAFEGVSLRAPRVPFVSNVTGTWITDAEATDRAYWVRQLRATVRFADGIETLLRAADDGAPPVFVEVGPSQTLRGLLASKRGQVTVVSSLPRASTSDGSALASWCAATGDLWARGVAVDWKALGANGLRVPLPTYPFERAYHWIAAGKRATNAASDSAHPLTPPPAARAPAAHDADMTPTEVLVSRAWREILGLDRIPRHQSFFDLGGDSLMASQLLARINDAFRMSLPLRDLFEHPTLAGIAARVDAGADARLGTLRSDRAIARRTEATPVAASFAQQRLFFEDRLEPGSSVYTMPAALRIRGALDLNALARAIHEIARRHDALRTTFSEGDDGAAIQIVQPPSSAPELAVETVLSAYVAHVVREDAARPFSLADGPLFRARVLRVTEEEHVLLLTMHHIVSDGWSMGVFVRELATLYAAFHRGESSPLADLPIQFADYAAWLREDTQLRAIEAGVAHFARALEGAPPLDLPSDRPRPPVPSHRGATASFTIPKALVASLDALGRKHGATLFMVLLGAYDVLLARLSGQTDVTVGTPVANRGRPELEPLIGFFVNTLVLRVDLEDNPPFRELLDRVREGAVSAFAHPGVPFERVVQAAGAPRDRSRSPLFQTMFVLQNAPMEEVALEGLAISPVPHAGTTSMFDMTVSLQEGSDGLRGSVEYATDLFDASTVERWLGHYVCLLESITATPECRVQELPLLRDVEERLVLSTSKGAAITVPTDRVHELFEAQVRARPTAIAVVHGADSVTYADLDARANQLAARLRTLGADSGAPVAVAMSRSIDMIVALLAVWKAGAPYLPLDLDYPAERLVYALVDAEARTIITRSHDRPRLPADFTGAIVLADDPTLADEGKPSTGVVADAASLAYVIYTSGSTGRPKGVAITHRNVASFLAWTKEAFTADEMARVLACTSICFDLSIFEIFAPLTRGGAVVLVEDALALDAATGVTLVNMVPSAIAALLDAGPLPASVRTVNLAGEPLTRALADRVYREPTVGRLFNLYGPTETTTYSSLALVPRDTAAPPTLGRPIANTQIYLLDANRRLVPPGVAGEIWIGGEGVTEGYLGRPDLTTERYCADPFAERPLARMYRTGDRGRAMASGELEYLGRLDHQVKIRGFRIELGEIESVLAAAPGVEACSVVVREDAPGDSRIVAYVVGDATSDACRAALATRVPAYMMPSAFVTLSALPLTPNGKVDRRALPAPVFASVETQYVAPEGEIELTVAAIFSEVLGVPRVGRHESFFDLGGHSLSAMRVVVRLRERLAKTLALRLFFDDPTPSGLARSLEASNAVTRPIPRRERSARVPASHAQHRLWILDQLAPGRATYNVPAALRIDGALDAGALARAIDAVVVRHEALRTTFGDVEGEIVQIIGQAPNGLLTVEDLSSHADAEARAALRAREEAALPFSLTRGPLFRARLLRVAPEAHVLLVTMHHIVSDGWSIGVLVRELGALYGAFARGLPSPLPALPLDFADAAIWQQSAEEEARLTRGVEERRRALAGCTALDLPTDRPRPSLQGYRGASRSLRIAPPLASALRELARANGATLFMVLLAAYDVLLARLSGQTDITVGTPIANRPRPELEPLIGFFVNTLVLRADLGGTPRFVDLLERVRASSLATFEHGDVPFERLVEASGAPRDPSRSPLFQTLFALQNTPGEALRLGDLAITPVEHESETAKFEMSWSLREVGDAIEGSVEYATDLFDVATIDRWADHFVCLLESIARSPRAKVSDLMLLRAEDQRRIVHAWNTHAAPEPFAPFHTLFEAAAATHPDAPALVSGTEVLSYAETNRRANRLARRLRSRGARADALVAIALERSVETVIAVLAVMKAGGAYVPLDPSYPQDRLDYMLDDSRAEILVTTQALSGRFASEGARRLLLDVPFDGPSDDANLSLAVDARHLAYAIYTSGSTGRPKGVLLEHGGLSRLAYAQHALFGRPERVLQFASQSFDASVWEMVMALAAGATLHVPRAAEVHPGPDLAAYVREHQIDRLTLPPSALAVMQPDDLATVTTLILAGESFPEVLAARWAKGRRLFNAYGPTEATVCATAGEWSVEAPHFPIGRPIDGSRVYILDAQRSPVPIGVTGEISIGGAGVARGYLGRPDLTDAKFVADPFVDDAGARMYRTGDRGRFLPDGRIEFLGRADAQVKVRGFRIELGEIEAVLSSHAAVDACAVIVREDAPGEARIVAYAVGDIDGAAVREQLARALPSHMVPSAIVRLDALPLTKNGKVDAKALPRPERSAEDEVVLPRTDDERVLARIWSGVLAVDVGVRDDLFALGATSLSVVRVAHAARAELGIDLPVQLLFAETTIEGQALAIARVRAGVAETGTIDWARETALDLPAHLPPRAEQGRSGAVALTGATGFLGSFLLADLLKLTDARVCCFVRARDAKDGLRRIRENLTHYGLFDAASFARVEAIPSDLARPRLGLDEAQWADLAARLTAVYHNGAHVDGNLPYALLKAANVDATRWILELATTARTIPIHYVSTLSVLHAVAPEAKVGDAMSTPETTPLENPAGLQGGYAESKWCAEQILLRAAAAGVPVAIYRPGRITGDTTNGASSTSDLPSLFLKGCTQLGAMPKIRGSFNAVPVDYVAGAVVRISLRGGYEGRAFHLSSPANVTWDVVFSALRGAGYAVDEVSYTRWRGALLAALADGTSTNAALTLAENFPETYDDAVFRAEATVDCRKAIEALGATFACPVVTRDVFAKYVDWMASVGFLGARSMAEAG